MKIETPYGATDIYSLSTGLKTLLNAQYLLNQGKSGIINASECGANAATKLFNIAANTNLVLNFNHLPLVADTNCKFLFNNKLYDNLVAVGQLFF